MMTKLVLTDVDLTLVDKHYQLTEPLEKVYDSIQFAQKNGLTIGLNSDSSFFTLKDWHSRLGLNGPIISERGARIWWPDRLNQIETAARNVQMFPELKRKAWDALHSVAGIKLLRGDANKMQTEYRPTSSGEKVIIFNDYRQRSFNFFARQSENGCLVIDNNLLAFVIEYLRILFVSEFPSIWAEKDEDINPDYGTYILHCLTTQKENAVIQILQGMDSSSQLWMVGDSMPDFINHERVKHVAVANAKEAFKDKVNLVMTRSITGGFIESLDYLVSN